MEPQTPGSDITDFSGKCGEAATNLSLSYFKSHRNYSDDTPPYKKEEEKDKNKATKEYDLNSFHLTVFS